MFGLSSFTRNHVRVLPNARLANLWMFGTKETERERESETERERGRKRERARDGESERE